MEILQGSSSKKTAMNKEMLERNLEKGSSFGCNLVKDSVSIKWLLLFKRKVINRFFERFTVSDNPIAYREQISILENPYRIWIAEVKRELYDSEKFPTEADYLINDNYFFRNLEEIEDYLITLNVKLSEIKWSTDVQFL